MSEEDLLTSENAIEYWSNPVMRRDFSPAEWTCKKPKYTDVTQIKLSFGGGMGGANRTMFILEKREDLKTNSLVEVTNFKTGEKETINTNFIVYANDRLIATVTYHTQNPYIIERYKLKSGNGTIHKIIPPELKGKITLA